MHRPDIARRAQEATRVVFTDSDKRRSMPAVLEKAAFRKVRIIHSVGLFPDIRHSCKLSVKWRHGVSRARSRERTSHPIQDVQYANDASRHRFLRSAKPDIHLLSQTPKSRHRRLSLCSLPVPKQIRREPRQSDLLRSVGNRQDLAVCAFLFILLISAVVMPQSCALQQARGLSVADPQQADTRPSSGLRLLRTSAEIDPNSIPLNFPTEVS